MAMQAGLGVSRILIIVGAGYTGTVLLQNGKISDLLAELQALLLKNGKDGESGVDTDPLAAQIRSLAMEVKRLASGRPITVLNGSSGNTGMTSLVVPAAALGALGYGYMKWKGIKFSDFMYVTKQNMSSAVANLTKHLQDVSDAVSATKRHLTQRIDTMDGKMDEQVELSKQTRNDISGVRDEVSQIQYLLEYMEKKMHALSDKMVSLDDKQDVANSGVLYLCGFVNGKKVVLPPRIQEEINVAANSVPSLMGLKDVVQALEPESNNKRCIADGISGDGIDKLNSMRRALFRTSIKG